MGNRQSDRSRGNRRTIWTDGALEGNFCHRITPPARFNVALRQVRQRLVRRSPWWAHNMVARDGLPRGSENNGWLDNSARVLEFGGRAVRNQRAGAARPVDVWGLN